MVCTGPSHNIMSNGDPQYYITTGVNDLNLSTTITAKKTF